MNKLEIFNNPQFGDVRIAMNDNNEPLFCLVDVCNSVGLTNPSSVRSRLDDEDVQLIDLHALNYTEGNIAGNAKANFITEGAFYDVLLQSSSPKVKPFRKWVTKEVLPAIRKTGGYLSTSEEDTPELIMAKALQVAQSTIERHQKQLLLANKTIKEQAPKVIYHDDVLQSPNTYTTTQIAKELDFSSADKFHKDLKARKVMFKQSGQWMLMAKYTGRGFTKTRTTTYTRSDGSTATNTITVWTESGRKFLHELYRLFPEDTKIITNANQEAIK